MKPSPIAYERAEMARDMEYTKCMIEDDAINQSLSSITKKMDNTYDPNEVSDQEINATIEQIPDDDTQRNEEIERIVQSKENLDIDGIMGYGNSYNELNESEEE